MICSTSLESLDRFAQAVVAGECCMLPASANHVLRNPKAGFVDEDLAALRNLTFDERGRLIASACRTAAEILAGRRQSGLPDEQPVPWPASTIEFLAKHAHASIGTG